MTNALAQCASLMYGVMLGGEYAGYQFFIDYARLLALQMSKKALASPRVRRILAGVSRNAQRRTVDVDVSACVFAMSDAAG